ncbi:hypothetical protein GCM10027447_28680 [Glycomyces halotolerans]
MAIAACTRRLVFSATASGRLSTLETVPTETPAARATSFMLLVVIVTSSSLSRGSWVAGPVGATLMSRGRVPAPERSRGV